MTWANTLINDYYGWLKSKTVVIPDERTEWVSIQTPFIGLFNDTIEMYAQKKGKKILLSDNGDTFHNLELVGASINRVGERRNIAERILLNYGIQLNNDELVTETTEQNFAQKKHNFLSAIMELNDLYVLSKPNVASIFKDDVRIYLDEQNIIYTPDFISKGSTGLEFMFDFQIAGKNSEIVIKSFNTINKQTLSSFLFSWDDIKPIREKVSKKNVTAIAFINDEDKPVKAEFLEALRSKHADFIIWSDRHKNDNIFKLVA
ncbi:DUF1828 domain-containing protein [Dyadobacter sp. CY323]|uniref:DUF1828 domain-containing protein n=1 Tax=Dyadobacter sp. CY323 TaxID=2907302 RepID=UPI001F2ECE47|nr:DUF1828 domain-containing protein [Dyadobacter sp. CY323]MCE6988489.1 DUF1828 domain-containing protein [Dyadobacter sp. CY323]